MTAIVAIVPAAGQSSRYRASIGATSDTGYKQLAIVNGRTMLAGVLDALDASRAERVIAVINAAIAPAIMTERPETPRRAYTRNDDPTSEMITSVQIGMSAARMQAAASAGPNPSEPAMASPQLVFLICPADIAAITTAAIDACIRAYRRQPDHVIIPTHSGRRGHPIILPPDIANEVEQWPRTARLSAIRERFAARTHFIEIPDAAILRDIDTRSDLSAT